MNKIFQEYMKAFQGIPPTHGLKNGSVDTTEGQSREWPAGEARNDHHLQKQIYSHLTKERRKIAIPPWRLIEMDDASTDDTVLNRLQSTPGESDLQAISFSGNAFDGSAYLEAHNEITDNMESVSPFPSPIGHDARERRHCRKYSMIPGADEKRKTLRIRINRTIRLARAELQPLFVQTLKERLIIENPDYLRGLHRGQNVHDTTRYLFAIWQDDEDYIIPRGFLNPLFTLCHQHRLDFEILDEIPNLSLVNIAFHGTLYEIQIEAFKAIEKNSRFVMLAGPPKSGRKVTALALAARRRLPVLIIVRTKNQLYQWQELLSRFLSLSKEEVGQIGDGEQRITGSVIIAIWDTLLRVLEPATARTGFLIVDDADHCGIKRLATLGLRFNCAYTLGLTTESKRCDSLTPFMNLHLGPIVYRFDRPLNATKSNCRRPVLISQKTTFHYNYRDDWQQLVTSMIN